MPDQSIEAASTSILATRSQETRVAQRLQLACHIGAVCWMACEATAAGILYDARLNGNNPKDVAIGIAATIAAQAVGLFTVSGYKKAHRAQRQAESAAYPEGVIPLAEQ